MKAVFLGPKEGNCNFGFVVNGIYGWIVLASQPLDPTPSKLELASPANEILGTRAWLDVKDEAEEL